MRGPSPIALPFFGTGYRGMTIPVPRSLPGIMPCGGNLWQPVPEDAARPVATRLFSEWNPDPAPIGNFEALDDETLNENALPE